MDSFFARKSSTNPSLGHHYQKLLELFEKKLWHELTLALEVLLFGEEGKDENYLELYSEFIVKFETRLNPLKLVNILSKIADSLRDYTKAIQFFDELLNKSPTRAKFGVEASMCLDIDIAHAKLRIGKEAEAKQLLDTIREEITKIQTSDTLVFSKFYRVSADLRKVIGPPQEFYNAALQYLAYTSLETLSTQTKLELATDIALAAASSEFIFNFGEALTNPILQTLRGTPNEWLCELMMALHKGNINEFNRIIGQHQQAYYAQPALKANHEIIKQKLILLTLVTMVFERPPHERRFQFTEIAQRMQVPLQQVEWIIMKALSLRLMEGWMDEVDGFVVVTWVLPRVLETEHIKVLSDQLSAWIDRTKNILITVEERSPEIMM